MSELKPEQFNPLEGQDLSAGETKKEVQGDRTRPFVVDHYKDEMSDEAAEALGIKPAETAEVTAEQGLTHEPVKGVKLRLVPRSREEIVTGIETLIKTGKEEGKKLTASELNRQMTEEHDRYNQAA